MKTNYHLLYHKSISVYTINLYLTLCIIIKKSPTQISIICMFVCASRAKLTRNGNLPEVNFTWNILKTNQHYQFLLTSFHHPKQFSTFLRLFSGVFVVVRETRGNRPQLILAELSTLKCSRHLQWEDRFVCLSVRPSVCLIGVFLCIFCEEG